MTQHSHDDLWRDFPRRRRSSRRGLRPRRTAGRTGSKPAGAASRRARAAARRVCGRSAARSTHAKGRTRRISHRNTTTVTNVTHGPPQGSSYIDPCSGARFLSRQALMSSHSHSRPSAPTKPSPATAPTITLPPYPCSVPTMKATNPPMPKSARHDARVIEISLRSMGSTLSVSVSGSWCFLHWAKVRFNGFKRLPEAVDLSAGTGPVEVAAAMCPHRVRGGVTVRLGDTLCRVQLPVRRGP